MLTTEKQFETVCGNVEELDAESVNAACRQPACKQRVKAEIEKFLQIYLQAFIFPDIKHKHNVIKHNAYAYHY